MTALYSTLILVFAFLTIFFLLKLKEKNRRIANLLDLNEMENNFRKVDNWLISEKNYLRSNIKLSHIAREVHLSEKQVSRAVNTITGKNISAYINCLRVKEAKMMLVDRKFDKYTIDAIGEMAGFSNKVSFYRQFKTISKQSPADYRKLKETKTPR